MIRKTVLLSLLIAALVFLVGFFVLGSESQSLSYSACDIGVVNKKPREDFDVKITFKNSGTNKGTWSVNIAFEGEVWTWAGTPQVLVISPSQKKTLMWNGTVPSNAPLDSIARLIVYYNDSVMPLDRWIRIVSGAELSVTESKLR
jgi:hypothetical protein